MYLGIDIGGTQIKFAAVRSRGHVVSRGVLDTPSIGARAALRRVATAATTLVPGVHWKAVGIGCAGLVRPGAGTLVTSPNLPEWEGTRLAGIARRAFGVYVRVENDATSAAWGEYVVGGWGPCSTLILVTLGTGVGGGIICDGRVVRGQRGFAGEIGHITVDPRGRRCRCGNRGCLESVAGGWAIVASARRALAHRTSRYLTPWIRRDGRRLTPRLVAEAARRGDRVARAVMADAGEALGVAISSLVNAINPGAVVFGGGVAASFDLLEPYVRRQVTRRAFAGAAEKLRLVPSKLGNDAAVVGAALLARQTAP